MAPTGPHIHSKDHGQRERVIVVPLRGKVLFPPLRSSIEVSQNLLSQVQGILSSGAATGIGAVAVRPSERRSRATEKGGQGPGPELYEVGTLFRMLPSKSQPEEGNKGWTKIDVESIVRFKVLEYTQTTPVRLATVELLEDGSVDDNNVEIRALVQSVQAKMTEMVRSSQASDKLTGKRQPRWPNNPATLTSVVGATLAQLTVEERQRVLETLNIKERLEIALDLLQRETEAKRLSSEITQSIQRSRDMELRQMVLQRQIHEIQRELQRIRGKASKTEDGHEDALGDGEAEEEEDEVARLTEKINQAQLPDDAQRIAKRELRRLKNLQPQHPEYSSAHSYLELLSSLPWHTSSKDRFDLVRARHILDEDHQGLDKVKLRILEFLAVQKLRGNMKGPILCLHGPPGIGKTSLGRSVARSLGRKFFRVALGGVRDEAELRGHRRTYIGSIPGVLIQAFQTLGVNNPVILLDEVDKMSQNSMFNPQAAMLEILDPEQNDSFKDHYLNTPFDLSKVLFICTANDTSLIDRPLLDRMEVIELSGYTVEEKASITLTHLLPKQRRLHALEQPRPAQLDDLEESSSSTSASAADTTPQPAQTPSQIEEPRLQLTSAAVTAIITKWTSESGVRNLERRLAQICRWAALRLQNVDVPTGADQGPNVEREAAFADCGPDSHGRITVDARHLPFILGVEIFEPDIAERLTVGVAMGLSVSSVGGQLLFIEAAKTVGSGRLTITGQLGKVMTESVETALSLLRSRFVRMGQSPTSVASSSSSGVLDLLHSRRAPFDEVGASSLDRDPFKGEDIHVHFPAGGIPKDGPSAGVAVLLALASLLLDKPMRSDTAVTGEVTLRGHVLPVGGIRDKVLAAHRAGVRHVLLPLANQRHVQEEIPAEALKSIEIHYMKHVDEALDWAFGRNGSGEADVAALAAQDIPSGVPAVAAASSPCPAFLKSRL